MIVRIMGEGQWDVPDEHMAALNVLDEALGFARERGLQGLVVDLLGAQAHLLAVIDRARAIQLTDEAVAIANVAGWAPRVASLRLEAVRLLPAAQRQAWLDEAAPALFTAQDRWRHGFFRAVLDANKAAATQAVTIMADKQLPYSLLRKVMFTCARANFADVSFAIQRKDV